MRSLSTILFRLYASAATLLAILGFFSTAAQAEEKEGAAFCVGGGTGSTMAVSNIVPKSVLIDGGAQSEDFDRIEFGGDNPPFLDLAKDKAIDLLTRNNAVPTLNANGIPADNMGCFVAPSREAADNFINGLRASNKEKKWIEIPIGAR